MCDLYLHIGMNKAGSTSCQRLFYRNQDALAAQGLHYLRAGRANHSFFMAACFGTPEAQARVARRWGLGHEEAIARWEAFLDETRAERGNGLVSAEMSGGGFVPGLARLRDGALRRFNALVVLALIRPPLAYARSLGQQWLKGRVPLSHYRDHPPLPRYRGKLERYIALVGARNVKLEIFHRDRMVDGDPARTLFEMMGRSGGPLGELRAGNENPAMSMTAAKLLSVLQAARRDPSALRRLPELVLDALRALPPEHGFATLESGERPGEPLTNALVSLVRRVPGGRFQLPIDVQRAVMEQSREEVAWISRLLGARLDAYDIEFDETAPTLDEAEFIDAAEAGIIAAHLATARSPTS